MKRLMGETLPVGELSLPRTSTDRLEFHHFRGKDQRDWKLSICWQLQTVVTQNLCQTDEQIEKTCKELRFSIVRKYFSFRVALHEGRHSARRKQLSHLEFSKSRIRLWKENCDYVALAAGWQLGRNTSKDQDVFRRTALPSRAQEENHSAETIFGGGAVAFSRSGVLHLSCQKHRFYPVWPTFAKVVHSNWRV